MAETLLNGRRSATAAPAADTGRRLRRRRALPGGRAVVGGFLVAASAVGVFAAYLGATADHESDYLVAGRELVAGDRIARSDLRRLRADLPADLKRRVFSDGAVLVGAVVLGPVGEGELVQRSDVLAAGRGQRQEREISFPIESARAVDGQLRPGELVDVLATYGTGAEAYTVVVARAVRIADRSEPEGGLAGGGEQVVTLSLPSEADTLALAHAVNAASLTLVRTPALAEGADAGAAAGEASASSYRTPQPAGGASAADPLGAP
ncbi:MAG: hypothetical protein ACRDZW_05120 [Acidimicrobiales bacterium]